MNEYEQKQADRIERLKAAAGKLRAEAGAVQQRVMGQADQIPLGQPILVGHHSEGRDRRTRDRIRRGFERAHELEQQAQQLARAALAAERNHSISGDDPEAGDKLQARIAELEQRRVAMVERNRTARAQGAPAPHERWELANLAKNLQRLRNRLSDLTARDVRAAQCTTTWELVINGVRVVQDYSLHRLQLFYKSKPLRDQRENLRRNGFVWAPSVGAWQRQLNNAARHAASCVLGVDCTVIPEPPVDSAENV